MYRLYGILKVCYLTGDLEEYSGNTPFWLLDGNREEVQKIILREVAKLSSPCNIFTRNRYNCSGVCDTRRLSIQKEGYRLYQLQPQWIWTARTRICWFPFRRQMWKLDTVFGWLFCWLRHVVDRSVSHAYASSCLHFSYTMFMLIKRKILLVQENSCSKSFHNV